MKKYKMNEEAQRAWQRTEEACRVFKMVLNRETGWFCRRPRLFLLESLAESWQESRVNFWMLAKKTNKALEKGNMKTDGTFVWSKK